MNKKYDIIIMGAGPAGASLGILLAKKKGLKVLVIEKNKKQVHKIGESLLPDTTGRFAKILGIKDDIDKAGFPRKYGASIIWGKSRKPWNVIFDPKLDNFLDGKDNISDHEINRIFNGNYIYSYQVNRYEFDSIYIKKLKSLDIDLHLGEEIIDINLKENNSKNEIETIFEGKKYTYEADLIVDATGQKGIIANKLNLKEYIEELGFISYYTYFKNFNFYDNFYSKHTQHIISINIGWIWVINIGNVVSVGLVTDNKNIKKKEFLLILKENIGDYLKGAIQVDFLGKESDNIYIANDWSYLTKHKYGKNYLLIGDSSGFVDPVLSGGVSFAVNSAFLAYKFIIDFFNNNKDINIFKNYERLLLKDQKNYYEMAKFWYGNNKSVDSFFWRARDLLGYTKDKNNIFNRKAFIYLTSGKHYSDKYLKIFEGEINIGGEGFDKTERIEIENLVNTEIKVDM